MAARWYALTQAIAELRESLMISLRALYRILPAVDRHHRCAVEFIYQQSHFFENSFLVKGLINPERFVPMFGMCGLLEAVNLLCEKKGVAARYGKKPPNEAGLSHQRSWEFSPIPREIWLAKTHILHADRGSVRYRHHAGRTLLWR